jgi:hypothetical protein
LPPWKSRLARGANPSAAAPSNRPAAKTHVGSNSPAHSGPKRGRRPPPPKRLDQPNRTGIARLDAYFDPNERRYFIAPQSVDLAIAEEKAKAIRGGDSAETAGADASSHSTNVPKPSEASATAQNEGDRKGEPPLQPSPENAKIIKELEKEIMDLKITNRAKDYFIERLEKDREKFAVERHGFINKLMSFTRRIGQMESKLLQLGTPKGELDAISSIEENFSDAPEKV